MKDRLENILIAPLSFQEALIILSLRRHLNTFQMGAFPYGEIVFRVNDFIPVLTEIKTSHKPAGIIQEFDQAHELQHAKEKGESDEKPEQ